MHELDKQLHEMKQAMMRRTHLLARMNTLLDQRDVLREKEQRLFEKLSKEEADVEKMEGGSLRKYMCYIMGNYDEKLDIEKQEAYEARVRYDADVQIQMDSFLHFADFFFDGIFADWAVMDHIEKSQKQIRNVTRQVGEVLQTLEAMLQENETTLADIQAQRDTLIVEY